MNHAPSPTRLVAAVLSGALLLFVWGGLAQQLPWGLGSVRSYSTTQGAPYVFAAPGLRTAPPGTYVTDAFETELARGISTLATDTSFSWVVSVPRSAYDPARYLGVEALTQLAVAATLGLLLTALRRLERRAAIVVILGAAAAALLATYGAMANWWGLPMGYAGGMAINLVVGWGLAVAVMQRILRAPGEATR